MLVLQLVLAYVLSRIIDVKILKPIFCGEPVIFFGRVIYRKKLKERGGKK